MAQKNMPTPVTRTASGDTCPANATSRAKVYATLLDGATLAIETTKSPHRPTAFSFRPTWARSAAGAFVVNENHFLSATSGDWEVGRSEVHGCAGPDPFESEGDPVGYVVLDRVQDGSSRPVEVGLLDAQQRRASSHLEPLGQRGGGGRRPQLGDSPVDRYLPELAEQAVQRGVFAGQFRYVGGVERIPRDRVA